MNLANYYALSLRTLLGDCGLGSAVPSIPASAENVVNKSAMATMPPSDLPAIFEPSISPPDKNAGLDDRCGVSDVLMNAFTHSRAINMYALAPAVYLAQFIYSHAGASLEI
jgi:hypothetical protein